MLGPAGPGSGSELTGKAFPLPNESCRQETTKIKNVARECPHDSPGRASPLSSTWRAETLREGVMRTMPAPLRRYLTVISTGILLAPLISTAFPASAVASHVSCGETITTDTTLDSDLVNCPNNGIVIGASDITLDLNGHTIDGNDALVDPCPEDEFCDVGVANDDHNNVRVIDGTVTEFAFGVYLFGARENALRDLATIEIVFSGIILVDSARTRVRGNTTSRNAGPDSGVGMTLFSSHNNRIIDNTSADNAELGIHLIRSDRNHIGRNRVRRNPEDRIILEGDRNRIVRNRLVGNSIGVTTFTGGERSVGNVVRRNQVRRAPRAGIYASPPTRAVIRRNHVFGAGADGISVGSSRTTLTRNEARNNGRLGINAVAGVIDGGGTGLAGTGIRASV
ncbi:MAG TPA: NosD domain-containing protein [Actinomycetota bacterium]|nr:NosD domain-containing protein [Actinomycetota bacterium]